MPDKVRVRFLPEDLLVEAPPGTPLQDIADAAGADLTFGCRSGSCGTCRVCIRGAAFPAPCTAMGREERDFLAALGAGPGQRLACQVRVLGDIDVISPEGLP